VFSWVRTLDGTLRLQLTLARLFFCQQEPNGMSWAPVDTVDRPGIDWRVYAIARERLPGSHALFGLASGTLHHSSAMEINTPSRLFT
jgi:hypothetical protein